MDTEQYEEAVRDYETLSKLDKKNHGIFFSKIIAVVGLIINSFVYYLLYILLVSRCAENMHSLLFC